MILREVELLYDINYQNIGDRMVGMALVGTVARNAIIGTIITKTIDTLIVSKINRRMEEKRWLRDKKLDLFANLSEELLTLDNSNLENSLRNIKRSFSRLILLLDDKKIISQIDSYVQTINSKKIDDKEINRISLSLIYKLNENIRKA